MNKQDPDLVPIPLDDLRDLARDILTQAGVPRDDAVMTAASLLESNLCGHDSHGVQRLLEYVDLLARGELRPDAGWTELTRLPAVLVVDAQRGLGQVQCVRLVDELSSMARSQGVAVGAARQCGHVGRLGAWVERAAADGLAAWMSVTDNGTQLCVTHPFGAQPLLGTNPLAMAAPTDGDPLVVDMSTSVVASGKVTKARLAGDECPAGWLQDAAGQPTTDPHILGADPPGALLPLGGFKGFALGAVLDALVSGLSGGLCPDGSECGSETNNVLMIVIDPDQFCGKTHFVAQATALAAFIRGSCGTDEPLAAPGDRSAARRRRALADGRISLDRAVWEKLQDLRG